MLKRLISAVLAILIFAAPFGVCASVEYSRDFAVEILGELDIMRGDEKGNLNLESPLTRAEFAKIAVNSSAYKNSVAHGAKISVFKDCTYKHWSAPYVKVAATNGIITGYPDSTFRPDNYVIYEEALTVMLRLLGYTDEDFGNTWPYGQINLAKSIGITKNMSASMGESITREDTLKLVYNVLNTKKKDNSQEYASFLDVQLFDDTVIIATNKEDNSVAPGKVLTGAGTFNSNDYIKGCIGLKGALAVNTNGEILSFVADKSDKTAEYVVYSVLSDKIIAYHEGVMTELKVSDSTPVYSGAEKLNFVSARSEVEIGDIIDVVTNGDGSVEYLTLTKDSMAGPFVLRNVSGNWYKDYTNDLSGLIVIRNDLKVSPDAVEDYDVLYYSKELNTAFVYANTITGIYEEALPNKDTPTSVKVSGIEYNIETVGAFSKLSSAGDYPYGSSVTLLLGKEKGVVDVVTSGEASQSSEIVGFLLDCGLKQYQTNGENYTSRYVSVILPDGTTVEYKSASDYSNIINNVVKVEFKENIAYLTRQKTSGITGRIDYDNLCIESVPVSENVNIVEVSTTRSDFKAVAKKIYFPRLDGITLSSSSVLWYKKNSNGEVTELILDDVTGDTAVYGIVTDANVSSGSSMNVSGSYTVDSNGNMYRYSGGILSNIKKSTPVKLVVSGTEVQTMKSLNLISGDIKEIKENIVSVGNSEYKLSDNVIVYKQLSLGGSYVTITLTEFKETYKDYDVSMYQDRSTKLGGRIRVIMIR